MANPTPTGQTAEDHRYDATMRIAIALRGDTDTAASIAEENAATIAACHAFGRSSYETALALVAHDDAVDDAAYRRLARQTKWAMPKNPY